MSGVPPGSPDSPGLCRNCFTPIPPGSAVCARCGASRDYIPKARRANNAGFTVLGVFTTIVLAVVSAAIGWTSLTGSDRTGIALCSILDLAVFMTSLVLLGRPRESAARAYGFAILMTTIGFVALGALVIAGVFVACYLILSNQQHH